MHIDGRHPKILSSSFHNHSPLVCLGTIYCNLACYFMYFATYISECRILITVLSYVSFSVDRSPPVDGKIVVGAVVSVLLLIFMILGILWWKGCMGGRISREKGNQL